MSSSYRLDQFADPLGYIQNVAEVLADYPDDVIFHVTDPKTGIQRGCKWPPTIAEIVTACEVRMQDRARRERYRNWGSNNETRLLETPRQERPTLEQLKAKYGEHWGIEQPAKREPERAPSWASIVSNYQADPDRIARLMRIADGEVSS